MSQGGSSQLRYFRRLFSYVLAHKDLLLLVALAGLTMRALPFVYPWVIRVLIDYVVAPRPGASAPYPWIVRVLTGLEWPTAGPGGVPPLAERMRLMWMLIGISSATALAFAVAGFSGGHFNFKLGNRIVTHLRRDLFEHLQRLSVAFYHKQRTGGLVWRLMHEVHGVIGLVEGGMVTVLLDTLQLAAAVCLLCMISPRMTLAVSFILPFYVLTFKILNPSIRRASEKVNQHLGRISGNVQEQLNAISLIKSYAAEERETERFVKDNEEHYGYSIQQSRVGHSVGAITDGLIHLGTTTIIGLGGYMALSSQRLSAGEIIQFLGYVGILYGPVKRFADLTLLYQKSLASVRRVFRMFEITPAIREKPDAIEEPPRVGAVRFENVFFHYEADSDENRIRLDEDEEGAAHAPPAAPRWVLKGVDVAIEPGERVALVGPSGSGKSTIGSLLPRLYDVVEGRILVDGADVRDYQLAALRRSIGVVQQESFLLSGTIRDNLRYGRPDANDEDVIAAAQAANAHHFISDLPHKYDTLLGERGVNLSGGQRQRLSIARALLKDPRILILDEATSALDTESEILVQQALDRLMRGRTSLIIAHRLSTVRNADRILVLKDGQITEQGKHEDLVAQNGLYAKLVEHQFGHHPGAGAIPRTETRPETDARPARRRNAGRRRRMAKI